MSTRLHNSRTHLAPALVVLLLPFILSIIGCEILSGNQRVDSIQETQTAISAQQSQSNYKDATEQAEKATSESQETSAAEQQALEATIQVQQETLSAIETTQAEQTTQTAQIAESEDATLTAVYLDTATELAKIQPTDEARENLIATAIASASIIFGPNDGRLIHDEDGYIEATRSTQGVRNFIAEIRFFNPYTIAKGKFGYGLVFRSEGRNHQYRLYLTSDKDWRLNFYTGTVPGKLKQEGNLPNMDVSEGGSNLIRLVALDDQGWLYVNDTFVAELDLSLRFMGSVYAYLVFENSGNITQYDGFTVWRIP